MLLPYSGKVSVGFLFPFLIAREKRRVASIILENDIQYYSFIFQSTVNKYNSLRIVLSILQFSNCFHLCFLRSGSIQGSHLSNKARRVNLSKLMLIQSLGRIQKR